MPSHIKFEEVNADQADLEIDSFKTDRRVVGLPVSYTGTAASGETIGPEDLGRCVVDIFDSQRINVDLGFFHSLMRIHEGSVRQVLQDGSQNELALMVPMFVHGAGPNAIPTVEEDSIEADMQHDKNTLSAQSDSSGVVASGRIVYQDRVSFRYLPDYRQENMNFGSATTKSEARSQGNYAGIYIREAASNANADIVERVDVTVDGQTFTKQINDEEAQDVATIFAGQESPIEPWRFVDTTKGDWTQGGFQNRQVEVQITTNNPGEVKLIFARRVELSEETADPAVSG